MSEIGGKAILGLSRLFQFYEKKRSNIKKRAVKHRRLVYSLSGTGGGSQGQV